MTCFTFSCYRQPKVWRLELEPSTLVHFFPRNDSRHVERVCFPLTIDDCFDNDCVGKQPLAFKDNSVAKEINPLPHNAAF